MVSGVVEANGATLTSAQSSSESLVTLPWRVTAPRRGSTEGLSESSRTVSGVASGSSTAWAGDPAPGPATASSGAVTTASSSAATAGTRGVELAVRTRGMLPIGPARAP